MPTFKDSKSSVHWKNPEHKARVERFLAETYGGSMSEFLSRIALEKVAAWEERQLLLGKQLQQLGETA